MPCARSYWREVRRLGSVTSTNDVAAAAAQAGEAEGLVVVADYQTGGRGRLGRSWEAPPGTGLLMSMLFRPAVDAGRWPWLPLLVGVGTAAAVPGAALKWPNDLLLDGRKLGGLLAEVVGDAVVVGVGINVSAAPPGAAQLGDPADRETLLAAVLAEVGTRYVAWTAGGSVAEEYRSRCDTIGRAVRVSLPGGTSFAGRAEAVDDEGRLVVRDDAGLVTMVTAGDVVHVRAS